MDTISYILLSLTVLTLIIGLIIEYRPREEKKEKIAAKARLSRSGPFEPPPLFIKTTTYNTIPLRISYILPDITDEAIQLATEFCERELLKGAAKSIDYKLEDCFPGGGKKITATLIVVNNQSSRDADLLNIYK